jgi:hypothetical protein
LVNSGELTLGLSSYGDPFVISFEGLTNTSETAKAIISSGSGYVRLGENMAFYGWPNYGSALYATKNGAIKGKNNIFSKCHGSAICSDRNGTILLESPVINSSTYALMSKSYGSIEIETDTKDAGFTNIVNNSVIGILDNGYVKISDSYAQLLANNYQTGFYFAGTSNLIVEGDSRSYGLTGGTGQTNYAAGGTGVGITNGASQAFLIVSPSSFGQINMKTGGGKYRTTVPSTSNISSYVANPGRGRISTSLSTGISPRPDLSEDAPPPPIAN